MESEEYKKFIPHEYVVFNLVKDKSPADVTLRATEWAIITQLDGKKTFNDIVEILSLTLDEAINLFMGLIDKELIEVVSLEKPKEKLVPKTFFDMFEHELTELIGPVAPFVIDDTLMEMDETKESFKAEKVPDLIEHVSDEIMDNNKKVKFQQKMLNYLKGM